MSRKCPTCKGKGRWAETVFNASERITTWHYCEDCAGTGISKDPEDGEDWDIGGSSLEPDTDE